MTSSHDQCQATADVLERIARERFSDPATDDLTVPLAIELAERGAEIASLKARNEALSDGVQTIYARAEQLVARNEALESVLRQVVAWDRVKIFVDDVQTDDADGRCARIARAALNHPALAGKGE